MKIVVIGAGVAGLSIGWRLAKAGAETMVLERAQPGQGATWASAGMLAATAESMLAPKGEEALAHRSTQMWPDFAASIEDASGIRIFYRKDGALIVARDTNEAEELRARAEMIDASFIGEDEARRLVPLLAAGIEGALWVPEEAQVDNRALGRALATAFLRAGGNLQTNEAAVRVQTAEAGTVAVLTPFRQHLADAVVIAAGAWSGQIEGLPPAAALPVRPVKGEMIALDPPANAVLPRPLVWGNDVYLVPRGKRLLVGATVSDSGFDTARTGEARDWLHAQAAGLIPDLADWRVSEHWAGLRPGSPDGLPIIGKTALENVYVASGQYRNGILFAPAIGEAVQTLVLEGRVPPETAAFNPARFQN